MARYDEDLHENLFFQTLIGKYSSLFNEAAERRWMVCVPRCDTVFRLKLGRTDFENHILRPSMDGQSENMFISLNNKHVVVQGDLMKAGLGYKETRSVKILFDECFFNCREESYQVFCLEQPLEGAMSDDLMISLNNLEECVTFLWGEPGGEKVRRSVDRLLDNFVVERGSMRPIMDAALAIYTRAVQEVFKIRKLQEVMQKNYCKLAVETYVMANLHKKIFTEVCFMVAGKDSQLNKITRNLSDTSPQSLGIRQQYRLVLNEARHFLSQLNQFTTPLEKLYCFSHTVSCLKGAWQGEGKGREVLTADELLPILVYLVIVMDIPNWMGNLTYINRFHFSDVTYEEFSYYLTSFEAAVEYVRSEHVLLHNNASPSSSAFTQATVLRLRSNSCSMMREAQVFFELLAEGDSQAVKQLLDQALQEKANLKSGLCHPLCDCRKCTELFDKQRDDSDKVSVHLRDHDGRTGLHYAALMGHNGLVQLLVERGAITTATDHNSSTPLHLSCLKGHQKCTLLLLSRQECSINALDNHGNTPLHQACSNGHEECVKALLFHITSCDVNAVNEQGDTPLHNGARWGHASIVSELLRMGANPLLHNRRGELPFQCAQNRKVQELLYKVILSNKSREESGGGVGGVEMRDADSSLIIRSRRMSKRLIHRESVHESDRQLKKLFRAIQDGDVNLVSYIFGWEESSNSSVLDDLCHPLCQCDHCSRLRKTMSTAVLSVNCTDMAGLTPLHKACLLGQRVLVEMLLKHGALLNIGTTENKQTPLHLACQYNQKDVVLVLLEYDAMIDTRDSSGNTSLHFACSNGHVETTMLLLMHGADVSLTNLRGDTPLHNAARWNHPVLVNELLLYGASYMATNNHHKTPADLTSDDSVLELVRQAINGCLVIGSYKPLRRTTNHLVHTSKTGTHNTDHPDASGNIHAPSSDYSHTDLGGLVHSDMPGDSSGASSSDMNKSASSEHAQCSDQEIVKEEVIQKRPHGGETCTFNDKTEGRSYDNSDDRIGIACDTGTGSLPEDEAKMWPQAEAVPLYGDEHRTLCNQWADSKARRCSSEWEIVTVPKNQTALEEHTVVSAPVEYSSGVKCVDVTQNRTSDVTATQGQSLDVSSSQYSRHSGWSATVQVHSNTAESAAVAVVDDIKPDSQTYGNLIQLLSVVEAFDRSTLNQSLLKAKKPQFIPLPPSPPLPVHDSPPPMTPTHLSSLTCVPVSPPPSPHASLPSSPPPSGHSSFSPPPPTHASLSPPTHTHLSPSPIPLTHTSLPPSHHSPTHAVIPSAQDYLTPLEELQTAGLGVSGPGPDGTKHIH